METTNGNGKITALTTTQPQQLAQFGELSVQGIVDRKHKILEVMRDVMTDGVHYGKIPGCGDKPALFKSGAEILATTFALRPEFAITKSDLGNGHREYEIICTLVHIPTGLAVGAGVGSCSTMESKYRWRNGARVCPDCGKSGALLKSKQKPEWFCWVKKDGCGETWPLDSDIGRQISEQKTDRAENPDIADQWNTVLKMAKKRAQVDATLTATGASDLLTQDIEDLAPASRDRPDVEDAEFTERPSNGETQRQQARGPSNEDKLEEVAHDLILDIDAAKSPDDVRKLAPRFAALPKGSRPRQRAYEAYNRRIADTTAPGAA